MIGLSIGNDGMNVSDWCLKIYSTDKIIIFKHFTLIHESNILVPIYLLLEKHFFHFLKSHRGRIQLLLGQIKILLRASHRFKLDLYF